jgi:uncharacterized protein YdaU (DUF1376 family)
MTRIVDNWLPLFVSDYLADTFRLTTLQHGIYFLLLMHYWRHGPLVDDAAELARIAGLNAEEWAANERFIRRFFHLGEDGLLHQKRMDAELERAVRVNEQRVSAGSKGGSKRVANVKRMIEESLSAAQAPLDHGLSDAQAALKTRTSTSTKEESSKAITDSVPGAYVKPPIAAGGLVDDPDITISAKEGRIFMGRWVLDDIIGWVIDDARIDLARWAGHGVEAQVKDWLRSGYEVETIRTAIKRKAALEKYRVPSTLSYFTPVIKEEHGKQPASAR